MDKIINHKYFKYLKIFGWTIILCEVLRTGIVVIDYWRFIGTEEESRFLLVLICLTIKLSLLISLFLISLYHPIYEKIKEKKWFSEKEG